MRAIKSFQGLHLLCGRYIELFAFLELCCGRDAGDPPGSCV